MRKCICCKKPFLEQSKYNHICDACKRNKRSKEPVKYQEADGRRIKKPLDNA